MLPKNSLTALLLVIILAILFLLSPKLTFAATTSYKITDAIPPSPINPPDFSPFTIWYTKSFTLNYTSGDVWISSSPDGTGAYSIDDGYTMTIIKPNGVRNFFGALFEDHCSSIFSRPPGNLKNVLGVGVNNITIDLKDTCGGFKASTALYLTYEDPNLPLPTPSLTPTPTPTPTPSPTPPPPPPIPTPAPPSNPLVFIPGIMGSELKINNSDEVPWLSLSQMLLPGSDDYFDVLKMQNDGDTSEHNIGITDNLVDIPLLVNDIGYGPTITYFTTTGGYTKGKDFFTFAYDWRKDIRQASLLLASKIQDIKEQTKAEKVDLVAHSMGGLVAIDYLSKEGNSENVRRLINIGTPHLGSVKATMSLLHGDCIALDFRNFCGSLNTDELKDISQNMKSVYQLTPSQKYFQIYDGSNNFLPAPLVDQDDVDNDGITGNLDYSQLKAFMTKSGLNTLLFAAAESIYPMDEKLNNINDVDITLISGSGLGTIGQVKEKFDNYFLFKHKTFDKELVNGDQTVPVISSSLYDPYRNLDYAGNVHHFYTNAISHSELPQKLGVLKFVKNILDGSNALTNDILDKPSPFNGDLLSVHSPVNLHAYDQNGNHTGPLPNGDFEVNIPDSSYDTIEDAKFIFLPQKGVYSVKFEGTGDGTFDFKVRDYQNDQKTSQILFNDVPVTENTKAETAINTSVPEVVTLSVDEDGNGIIDNQLSPFSVLVGDQTFDETPPTINTNIPGENATYILNQDLTVQYSCSDEGGSGLDSCTGSLKNGEKLDTQTVGDKLIVVKAIDKAGNEDTKEIKYKVQYANNGICLRDAGHVILQPINDDGSSIFKQGRTVPIKFRVCDYNGMSISDQKLISSLALVKSISGTVLQGVNESDNVIIPDANFRFDSTDQQWIYNLTTKNLLPNKTYFYRIELGDGSKIEFSFGLK